MKEKPVYMTDNSGSTDTSGCPLFLGHVSWADVRGWNITESQPPLEAGWYNFSSSISYLDIFRELREDQRVGMTLFPLYSRRFCI